MKKCVGFIVMVVLLTTMSTSVYAKDRKRSHFLW